MNDLLNTVIEAHGGLTRWKRHRSLSATLVTGGGLWAMKGLVQDSMPRTMWVDLHEQRASVTPFGKPEWRTAFAARRVAIDTTDGAVVEERLDPRASFVGGPALGRFDASGLTKQTVAHAQLAATLRARWRAARRRTAAVALPVRSPMQRSRLRLHRGANCHVRPAVPAGLSSSSFPCPGIAGFIPSRGA